uniref:Ig-like domain-containing protein n=1 Tax=Latimeria chalumnae TaxID=7897 RepID=H3AGI2_LATCH
GESILLTCLYPAINASEGNFTCSWRRADGEAQSMIYRYSGERPEEDPELPPYRNRTELASADPHNGNCSIHLHKVSLSDRGHYECSVSTTTSYGNSTLELHIAYEVEVSASSCDPEHCNATTLTCKAQNGFPEGSIEWFDSAGADHTQNAATTTSVKTTAESLFNIHSNLSVSFLSDLNYTCSFHNPHVGTTNRTITPPSPGELWVS